MGISMSGYTGSGFAISMTSTMSASGFILSGSGLMMPPVCSSWLCVEATRSGRRRYRSIMLWSSIPITESAPIVNALLTTS